jgi:hypothetical protein
MKSGNSQQTDHRLGRISDGEPGAVRSRETLAPQ